MGRIARLYDGELVRGIRTFEVRTGDRLLVEQRFDGNSP